MSKFLTVALILMVSSFAHAYEQRLPSCEELSRLWMGPYYTKLKPSLPYYKLSCHKSFDQMKDIEKASIMLARAAYVLDKTVFNYKLPYPPIVSYGRIQAPPKSMLDWVAVRIKGLVYNAYTPYAYASRLTGKINLTPEDFRVSKGFDTGIGLAGQIIHESRHIGKTFYGHVECTVPGETGPNCDPTISEEFDNGGSHAVAALWLAYIARNSYWPEADRKEAAETVRWVLKHRINDSFEVRNAFSRRYLWEDLY